MDTLSLTDLSQFIHHDGELFSNWVYVSSLAMRSYRKSPLLKRWCRVRRDDDRQQKVYLEFFINEDDIEPTKRISLSNARLVVSRGAKLTSAQFARIDRDFGPASPTVSSDPQIAAFYIDFPKKFLKDIVSRDNTIYETRSVRIADNGKDDFPLGFIMVSPTAAEAMQLETALSQGCQMTIPREKKRLKVQRWMNRAWMKLRGELSIDQFDEAIVSSNSTGSYEVKNRDEIFFTVGAPRRGVVPRIESLDGMTDQWPDDASGTSFITADGHDDDGSDDERIDRIALGGFHTAPGEDVHLRVSENNRSEFSSIEEMLAQKADDIRHATRISKFEILSVIDYVEQTKKFSIDPSSITHTGWSLCSEGENFDCFKSIDESTGIVRTRTWAKLRSVPPQTLFHILYQTEARKNWDHHYARFESEWTDPNDPELDIIDAVVTAPFGCANREFLEWRRRFVPEKNRTNRDGTFVIYLRSYDDVDRNRPVGKNNVRAEVWLSGYLIQWWKDESTGQVLGSQVLVMTQIDVKGLIPKYLVNALSSSGPKRWVKSVTAAAISEIDSVRKMTLESIMNLTDVQLDDIYQIHQ